MYLIGLGWLFLGIAIISDIFMEAIEVVTSQTQSVQLRDKSGKETYIIDMPMWNATVANLSLMALGSSAPEILLSVIETVTKLDGIPGELGPSTIVGSAAFNLLVISGLSIYAVGDQPKKIYDTGVFAVTSISSLFAYMWLYLVIEGCGSYQEVTMLEAWATLVYFFILIIAAFAADKLNQYLEEQKKTKDDIENEAKEQEIKIKRNQLRHYARDYSQTCVIEIA